MASYSGRFISNLERNDYVGSGSDKCKLRDDRFTHNDVKSRNREDNCLVSVNGNVYDITKYKNNIKKNKPDNIDKVFLDINCGNNYEVIKEQDIFQLKKLKTYDDNKGFFENLRDKIKSKYYYDDNERIKNMNLDELNEELYRRNIKYFDDDNQNENILRNRLLKNNEIRKNNIIYGLIAKFIIITIFFSIYYLTQNQYVLYIFIAMLIYELYVNIRFLFFDEGFNKNCLDLGSGFRLQYSQYKIGTIKNYEVQKFTYYAIFTIFMIFILVYYKNSGNHYILLTFVFLLIYNAITMYKGYKIKNGIVDDIKDKIYD